MPKTFALFITLTFALSALAADPATLVFSFQKQKNPEELKKSAQIVAQFLTKEIGHKVEVLVPTSYSAAVQGLISKKVHVAYMDSLPYLLASKESEIEIIAVEKRNGKTSYDSILVVPADSKIKSIKDLKGKSIAFSSQTSTSGYLFPYSRLIDEKEITSPNELNSYFSKITYSGGYDKALMAVLNQQVDAAALSDYAFEGAKSSLYIDEASKSRLRILTRTPGVPTHLVAVSKELSEPLRAKIQKALLLLSEKSPDTLSSVYGAAELIKPEAGHVKNTEAALKNTQLLPENFVK